MARAKRSQAVPAMDRKYEVEDALRTIQRAEEVQRNKPPMRDVKKMASSEQNALEKIKAIKR